MQRSRCIESPELLWIGSPVVAIPCSRAVKFDREAFVFRGSGRGTAFQKEGDAVEFHHRDAALNAFYQARLRFEDGDELLQVVRLTLWDIVRYQLENRLGARRRTSTQRRSAHG